MKYEEFGIITQYNGGNIYHLYGELIKKELEIHKLLKEEIDEYKKVRNERTQLQNEYNQDLEDVLSSVIIHNKDDLENKVYKITGILISEDEIDDEDLFYEDNMDFHYDYYGNLIENAYDTRFTESLLKTGRWLKTFLHSSYRVFNSVNITHMNARNHLKSLEKTEMLDLKMDRLLSELLEVKLDLEVNKNLGDDYSYIINRILTNEFKITELKTNKGKEVFKQEVGFQGKIEVLKFMILVSERFKTLEEDCREFIKRVIEDEKQLIKDINYVLENDMIYFDNTFVEYHNLNSL